MDMPHTVADMCWLASALAKNEEGPARQDVSPEPNVNLGNGKNLKPRSTMIKKEVVQSR